MQIQGMLTEFLIIIIAIVALLIIYYLAKFYRKPSKEKSNYLSALEFLADGNDKWALQKFKEAVREDSENVEAYLRLGDLLRKIGLANHALKIHKDLTLRPNLPQDLTNKIQLSLMLDYEILGNLSAAINVAIRILQKEKLNNTQLVSKLLTYYEREERWNEALEAVKKYYRKMPVHLKMRSALYLVFEGIKFQEKGEGKEARLKYREALRTDMNCPAAYYYLGRSYYTENRLEEAIHEWQNLSNKIPKMAHVAFDELEKTWFDLGKFGEAEKLYRKLLTEDPENIFSAISLAEIYNKKSEFDNALSILDKVAESRKYHPLLVAAKIQTLSNKNQYKIACTEAISYFQSNFSLSTRHFICQECQYESKEPLWKCPQCKSISSFEL